MRRFVEVTHERYKQRIGESFGGVVPAIFTDEPQFSRKSTLGFASAREDVTLPFTDDLCDTFRAAYREELLDHLPELIWDLPKGRVSLIRYHYHDHIAERFAQAFADTIGAWCKANNIMLTGHMMEEPTLESQTAALGDAMRSYRSFQLPGIDMLCDRREFTTAKQAASPPPISMAIPACFRSFMASPTGISTGAGISCRATGRLHWASPSGFIISLGYR